MLQYYGRVFPDGHKKGQQKYNDAKLLLRANPLSGHQFDDWQNVRELNILQTPFSIIYTIGEDTIYVIDIRDQRGVRRAANLQRFDT